MTKAQFVGNVILFIPLWYLTSLLMALMDVCALLMK